MAFFAKGRIFAAAVVATLALAAGAEAAPSCGKNGAGFDAWKQDFAGEARAEGVGQRGLSALAGATYATRTIAADRAMSSPRVELCVGIIDSPARKRWSPAATSMQRTGTDVTGVRRSNFHCAKPIRDVPVPGARSIAIALPSPAASRISAVVNTRTAAPSTDTAH